MRMPFRHAALACAALLLAVQAIPASAHASALLGAPSVNATIHSPATYAVPASGWVMRLTASELLRALPQPVQVSGSVTPTHVVMSPTFMQPQHQRARAPSRSRRLTVKGSRKGQLAGHSLDATDYENAGARAQHRASPPAG